MSIKYIYDVVTLYYYETQLHTSNSNTNYDVCHQIIEHVWRDRIKGAWLPTRWS